MKQNDFNQYQYQSSILKQNIFHFQQEQQQQYQNNINHYDVVNVNNRVSSKKSHPNQLNQQNKRNKNKRLSINDINKKSQTKLCLKFDSNSNDDQSSLQSSAQKDQNKINNATGRKLKGLKKIIFSVNGSLMKRGNQYQQTISEINHNQEEEKSKKKRRSNVLLINFDNDNDEDNSDDSSPDSNNNPINYKSNTSIYSDKGRQQQQSTLLTTSNNNNTSIITTYTNQHNSPSTLQTIQPKRTTNTDADEMKRGKPNILLTKFTDNSDSEQSNDQQHQQNHNRDSNKKQLSNHKHHTSQRHHHSYHQEQQVAKTITIDEFSRIPTTTDNIDLVYKAIPEHCVLQTIVKRYTREQMDKNGNIVYEMFDSYSYKSIMKAKRVSQGYELLWSSKLLSPNKINQKRISNHIMTTNNRINKQYISCGLVTCNFFGTQFNCYKFDRDSEEPAENNLEKLITIDYQTNFLGLQGPRKMQVYVPVRGSAIKGDKALSEMYQQKQCKRKKQASKGQYSSQQQSLNKIQKFINSKPKWNKQMSCYVLNFSGRATMSSVKNFIITNDYQQKVRREQLQDLVVFGKIDKHIFNLDIKHPFSLAQGFALAMSSFDKKIGCE